MSATARHTCGRGPDKSSDVLQARSERGTDRGVFKLHRNGDAAHESALFLSYGDRLVSQVRSSAPLLPPPPPALIRTPRCDITD
eukprot:1093571-Prymnesium_polylepis.1